jgi:hypothetical protein
VGQNFEIILKKFDSNYFIAVIILENKDPELLKTKE